MSSLRWFLVLLIGVSSLLCTTAYAASEPRDLLDAMSRNFRELDYHGLFTYEHGQTLSSLRLSHAVVDGTEIERVERLDGQNLSFERHSHGPDCVHPGALRLRGSGAVDVDSLERFYDFRHIGAERVAGHQGDRLQIVPKDRFRFGYVLVIDQQSSLLLKSEVRDGAGRLIERFQFVELEIGSAGQDSDLAQGAETWVTRAHDADVAELPDGPDANWQVGWIPGGFVASGGKNSLAGIEGDQVESRVYSDGLAVFSVFVEPANATTKQPSVASQGATIAYSVQRPPGYLVTVVGEVPHDTAQLVANSVSFPGASP